MAKHYLTHGDMVKFPINMQGGAQVLALVNPIMAGTGKSKIRGKKVCLEPDLKKYESLCFYKVAEKIGGIGKVKLKHKPANLSKNAKDSGKKMALLEPEIEVEMSVMMPAFVVKGPVVETDPKSKHKGKTKFQPLPGHHTTDS